MHVLSSKLLDRFKLNLILVCITLVIFAVHEIFPEIAHYTKKLAPVINHLHQYCLPNLQD